MRACGVVAVLIIAREMSNELACGVVAVLIIVREMSNELARCCCQCAPICLSRVFRLYVCPVQKYVLCSAVLRVCF